MLRRPLAALLLVLGVLAPTVPAVAVADHSGGYVVKASTSRPAASIASAATRVADPRCPDPTVCSRAIDLPFPVTLYGQTASRVWAQKEGTLLLRVAEPFTGQTSFPDATYGTELAPYLTHLEYAGTGDGVFAETTGTAPHRRTVVEWRSHQSATASEPVAFQVVLSEGTSTVAYRYLHVEATPRPVVGAQNDDASRYVTYAGGLRDGLTVRLGTADERVSQVRLTLPAGTVTYGQEATVRADVTRLGRGPVPTGQVAFFSDGVEIGRGRLDARGSASLTGNVKYLPDVYQHSLTARYLGDRSTSPGTSQAGLLVLAPATTSAVFVSPSKPGRVTYGTPYVVQVSVDPAGAGDPTGTVAWYDDDLGYVGSSEIVDGEATLPGTTLARGRHVLGATYQGNDHFTGFTTHIEVDVR